MDEQTAIEILAGLYLNEDWLIEYGSWRAAVDDFVLHSPDRVTELRNEICQLLYEESELSLRRIMRGLGMAYSVRSEPGGYRGWLGQVAHHLERRLGADSRGSQSSGD